MCVCVCMCVCVRVCVCTAKQIIYKNQKNYGCVYLDLYVSKFLDCF